MSTPHTHPSFEGPVLRPDGIVEIRIDDNHVCTVAEAKILTRQLRKFGKGHPVPLLRIAGEHSHIEDGVREFAASPESQEPILADAIVVRSLAQRILGNFYLKANKPVRPTQLFSTVAAAEEWLLTFMN
jgi:hypothetical protein